MRFKHINVHAENLLNNAMIVLIETEISGMYRVIVDYTNELEEKYHTVESVCRLLMISMAQLCGSGTMRLKQTLNKN